MGIICRLHRSWAASLDCAAADSQSGAGQTVWVVCVSTRSCVVRVVYALTSFQSGLDAVALVLVWLFVPGTERQIATMEEMNYVFGVTTRRHIRYQLREVFPWYVYNTFKRPERRDDLAPLYRYSRRRDTFIEKATESE